MYRFCLHEMIHYERARSKFCQVMAEGANRPQNVTSMHSDGVIDLMQPLLCDPELVIRSNAVCFFGRIANHSDSVAAELLERQIPQIMLRELLLDRNDNNHFRRAVMQALKAVAKHSLEMAEKIAEIGGLSAFLICAENVDVLLKEAACCAIGTIVKRSPKFAVIAIEQGLIPLLQSILQQPEVNLKQFAVLIFGDIARHSPDHARTVCTAIEHMSQILNETIDGKLKKQILCTLANVAEHNLELAEMVVNENIFPTVLIHLGHDSIFVRKQAARLVQEIAKQSLELAQIVVNSGGIGALVTMLQNSFDQEDDTITPCAMAIAYIAGQSPHFALALIECKAVNTLVMMLEGKRLNAQIAACIWALGHIGKHSSEHCKALADAKVFSRIMEIYINPSLDTEIRRKSEVTLKMCMRYCQQLPALEPLLYIAPPPILEIILEQFAKVLPNDQMAQRLFISTGGLKKILDIDYNGSENIMKWITTIKSCFSDDIVQFYKPATDASNMTALNFGQLQPKDFFVNPLGDDSSISEVSERSSFN